MAPVSAPRFWTLGKGRILEARGDVLMEILGDFQCHFRGASAAATEPSFGGAVSAYKSVGAARAARAGGSQGKEPKRDSPKRFQRRC